MAEKIRKWRSNHPINGVRVALSPHPGWRAPKDYAVNVAPAESLQDEGYNTYVSGVRAKILQDRHTDKGLFLMIKVISYIVILLLTAFNELFSNI